MAIDVFYHGRGLPNIGEEFVIDILVKISVKKIESIERRKNKEIVNIHRDITIALDSAQSGIIVGEHHRDLETTLLKIGRQFLLVRLIIEFRIHHMILKIPVTPVIFLV